MMVDRLTLYCPDEALQSQMNRINCQLQVLSEEHKKQSLEVQS